MCASLHRMMYQKYFISIAKDNDGTLILKDSSAVHGTSSCLSMYTKISYDVFLSGVAGA